MGNVKARGNKKNGSKNPQLEADMISLAEPESQTDPEFQTAFKDTLITAKCRAMHLSRTKAEKKKLPQMEERVKNVMFSLSP